MSVFFLYNFSMKTEDVKFVAFSTLLKQRKFTLFF